LCYVASLHSGVSSTLRAPLQAALAARVRAQPVVSCPEPAVWVEPELYCQVRFLEWTHAGRLRGASFHQLLSAPAPPGLTAQVPVKLPSRNGKHCPDTTRTGHT
jgi:hypothetical protein